MTILNTKKLPITLKHLTIVDCTLYRLIRSVTLVKSIGSAKPGKARVINFKARVKPEARALEKTGLFSITIQLFKSDIKESRNIAFIGLKKKSGLLLSDI